MDPACNSTFGVVTKILSRKISYLMLKLANYGGAIQYLEREISLSVHTEDKHNEAEALISLG